MATNLAHIIKGYITPDVIAQASSKLGESENNISKAFSTSISTLLGGIIHKSDDSDTMNKVMGLVKDVGDEADNVLTHPSLLISTAESSEYSRFGTKLAGLLIDNKQSTVTDAISRESGVTTQSATSVLGMAGTLLLSYFDKSITSAEDLKTLVYVQKDSILSGVPSGINFGSGHQVDNAYRQTARVHNSGSGAGKWIGTLLLLVAVAAGIYITIRSNSIKEHEKNRAVIPMRSTREPEMVTKGFSFTLPNGKVIRAEENGTEYKLTNWIKDNSKMVDKTTWFNFDRILFDNGKATLRSDSQEQLDNIAEILKAYPQVELKILGYTDNVGNPATNMKLSEERAKTVKTELVNRGIAAERLEAQGYGAKFPAASNDTSNGKDQNRRIAVRVTRK